MPRKLSHEICVRNVESKLRANHKLRAGIHFSLKPKFGSRKRVIEVHFGDEHSHHATEEVEETIRSVGRACGFEHIIRKKAA